MLPDPLQTDFRAFTDHARDNGILDSKTSLLVQLATAMALGCYP
jgi:hypothetical protein